VLKELLGPPKLTLALFQKWTGLAYAGLALVKPITGSKATKSVASNLLVENLIVVMALPESKR
jgi:hypothetical protein